MNDLQIFENEEFGQVRTVIINDEPWFVGKDVALALGYSNSRDALASHVDDEDKGVVKCDTPGGKQDMAIINESGLYSLIFGSKLESAKRFKHWVTSEVLPAIRKIGHYEMANPGLKASSISEVVNMAKLVRDMLKMQGGTPYQVAEAMMEVSKQIGFGLSSKFLLPAKLEKVKDEELDIVEFKFAFPDSSWQDYMMYRTLLTTTGK